MVDDVLVCPLCAGTSELQTGFLDWKLNCTTHTPMNAIWLANSPPTRSSSKKKSVSLSWNVRLSFTMFLCLSTKSKFLSTCMEMPRRSATLMVHATQPTDKRSGRSTPNKHHQRPHRHRTHHRHTHQQRLRRSGTTHQRTFKTQAHRCTGAHKKRARETGRSAAQKDGQTQSDKQGRTRTETDRVGNTCREKVM